MYIKTTYTGKLNGVFGIWCDFKPERAIISDEKQFLYAEYGKMLKHKITGEKSNYIMLSSDDTIDNYEEIEEERITPNDITQQNLSPLDSGQ